MLFQGQLSCSSALTRELFCLIPIARQRRHTAIKSLSTVPSNRSVHVPPPKYLPILSPSAPLKDKTRVIPAPRLLASESSPFRVDTMASDDFFVPKGDLELDDSDSGGELGDWADGKTLIEAAAGIGLEELWYA